MLLDLLLRPAEPALFCFGKNFLLTATARPEFRNKPGQSQNDDQGAGYNWKRGGNHLRVIG